MVKLENIFLNQPHGITFCSGTYNVLYIIILDKNDIFLNFPHNSLTIYEMQKLMCDYAGTQVNIYITRNVSIWHRCPHSGAMLNRAQAFCKKKKKKMKLKKGQNSHNNCPILPLIKLDLYFMIIYLCIKYKCNILIFSKHIDRKPFFEFGKGP